MAQHAKFRGAVYRKAKPSRGDPQGARIAWQRLLHFFRTTLPTLSPQDSTVPRKQFLQDLATVDTFLTGRHHNPEFHARQFDKLVVGQGVTFYLSDGATWLVVDPREGKFWFVDSTPQVRQRLQQIEPMQIKASVHPTVLYHCTEEPYTGGDLYSLHEWIRDPHARIEYIQRRWPEVDPDQYDTSDAYEIHCHTTLAEAKDFHDEFAPYGSIVAVYPERCGLEVRQGTEYPHPIIFASRIPAECVELVA